MKKTITEYRAEKIKDAIYKRFQCRSCDPKWNAQENLSPVGNHFVDDDTLKYFSARVQESWDFANGTLFAIKSTVGAGKTGDKGNHRLDVFDLFGHDVARFDANNAKSVKAQYDLWVEGFNALAHYKESGRMQARSLRREAARLSKALR